MHAATAQVQWTHYYSTDLSPKELSGQKDWSYEGVACYVLDKQIGNSEPLYRYANGREHFYTTDPNELGNGKNGYVYEGITCYVLPSQSNGASPFYRLLKGGFDHFYCSHVDEIEKAKSNQTVEGTQCYVYNNQIAGTVPLFRFVFTGNPPKVSQLPSSGGQSNLSGEIFLPLLIIPFLL
jgi:Repeat of unknown function (DUF5648)